mmetsp:Transcript_93179/g.182618  ORF Transcript_93179/g.182618 Transcript_93179/m.182618 type:complete len:247 (+) Transcript_93179:1384-2124(+)
MIHCIGQRRHSAVRMRAAKMPHFGAATFRNRSSVMPLKMPSSNTPARCSIPVTLGKTCKSLASKSSLWSGLATSTTRHRARSPDNPAEPWRRKRTSCSGARPWSRKSHSTTALPRPPVAPVSTYTAGSPSRPFFGTQGSLRLGAGIGSMRWVKTLPRRPASSAQMSVSPQKRSASDTTAAAWPRASLKQTCGTKTRWIRSSPASMATALLAPETIAPEAAAGHTITRRPATPASRSRWISCVKRQH